MLRAASEACANSVNHEEMARGQVFPSVDRIRGGGRDGGKRVALADVRPGVDVRAFVEAKSYSRPTCRW